MQHTTIAVDLAKSVFQVAISRTPGRVVGLIRFCGRIPKGGYDVHDVRSDEAPAPTPAV